MAIQAKISEKSRKIIREIVQETGESQIEVIEHAVMNYHKEWLMRKVNEAYAKLRKNRAAWQEELKERALLEKTLEDGLDDE